MIEILKTIPLFEGLEDIDLKKIAEVVKERNLPAKTVLVKAGDVGESFYLLKKGSVEIYKGDNGKEKKVATLSDTDENSFFGEMSLIEGAPRNATIVLATDCVLLEIDRINFNMMLRINSFIALRIMTALTKRFRSESDSAHRENTSVGKVYTIFSPKGGSGKSVFASNFAAGIAKHTQKTVLLIDLDLQFGDLAFMLGLKAKKTIIDFIDDNVDDCETFKKYLVKHPTGFSVLPSPFKPEQSELVNSTHLRKITKLAKQMFDIIIIDTHSLFQDLTINALDLSDIICLTMAPEMNHIKGMHVCLKVMETLKYPKDKIRMILNREESRYAKPIDEIETALRRKFDFSLHDDWKHACELVNGQKTIFDSTAPSQYRDDLYVAIRGLTGEKLENIDKGILSKLKKWFS